MTRFPDRAFAELDAIAQGAVLCLVPVPLGQLALLLNWARDLTEQYPVLTEGRGHG